MDRLPAPLDVRPFLHPDSSTLDPPAIRRDSSNSPSPSPVIPDRRRSRENQKILRPRKPSSYPAPPASSDADPAVISRIVDSFGHLPDDPSLNDGPLTHSRRSSRHSWGGVTDAPTRRSLSVSRRSAVMMDAGIRMLAPYTHQEDESDYDAALPPSVPTSRHYPPDYTNATPRTISARRMAKRQNLDTSPDPYGSDANPKNKLSAESWVRQGASQEQDTPEPKSIAGVRKLRRVNSKDSLRLSEKRSNQSLKGPKDSARLSEKHSNQSLRYRAGPEPLFLTDEPRAEQVFTKDSSPKPTPKGRLYLSDSGGSDGQASPEMLRSPAQGLGLSLQPDYVASYDSSRDLTPEEAVKRLSTELNKRMSIVDSVPTRTSSLQRRVKKAKRDSLARAQTDDSTTSSRLQEQHIHVPEPVQPEDTEMLNVDQASPIMDASWTDLGEDDHTVRRIRQLREQRKNRLAEGQTSPGPTEDAFADFDGLDSPRKDEPANAPNGLSSLDKIKQQHASEQTPEPSPVREYSIPTPPMNQDGAFGRTMSALSARDAESTRNQLPTPARSLSPSDSAMRQSLDAQAMSDTGVSPTPFMRRATTKKRSKSQRRGGTRLPDLPDDMEEPRSNRRRSMSAAGDPISARRDSIEISVRDYLRARRLNRKVRHPQTGRIICFSEVGDPHGHAVFVCVGMGLTRFVTAFFDELATTLGLRLVTLDRPGVGGSQAYPPGDKSGPLNWPDDVLAVCYELGIDKFSMLAHSAGAVYALATALILPNMVRGKIHLLAPWIPPSQLTVTHHPSSASQQQPGAGPLPRSQRILRVLPASVFKAANSTFISTTSASIKPATKKQIDAVRAQQQRELYSSQPPPTVEIPQTAEAVQPPTHIRRESMMVMDQYMPETTPQQSFGSPAEITEAMQEDMILASATPATDPELSFAANSLSAAEYTEKARKIEYTSRLTHRTWELATRDSNPATDLLVCLERHREIGFRYTDIDQPVVITHGSEDKRVPVGNVRWLAQQMNARAEAVRLSLIPDSPTRPDSRDTWYERGRGGGGCEIRVLDGEEHGLMASASIMSDVLEEISEYWRAAGNNH